MRRLTNLGAAMLFVLLGSGAASRTLGQTPPPAKKTQDSADGSSPAHPAATAHGRSVKLSWVASVPASNKPRDAVVGYNIYRSTKAHDRHPQRINAKLCTGTAYVDSDIKTGKTYFYVTRGVTATGVESGPSNEIVVKIRSHE